MNNSCQFVFYGWEIDRVVQFVRDIAWLKDQRPDDVIEVTGELEVHDSLSPVHRALEADSTTKLMFHQLPGAPEHEGYVRHLKIAAVDIDGSESEVTVGGANAVLEDYALASITFKVGLAINATRQPAHMPSDQEHSRRVTLLDRWNNIWQLSQGDRERKSQMPTWSDGMPTSQTLWLDDKHFQLYLLEYLSTGAKKLFDNRSPSFESCVKQLACAIVHTQEAERLVRMIEDFDHRNRENNPRQEEQQRDEACDMNLTPVLASHYHTLGANIRQHFSRRIKALAFVVNREPAGDKTAKAYDMALHYAYAYTTLGPLRRQISANHEEFTKIWESIWFLDHNAATGEHSYCNRVLPIAKSLLDEYQKSNSAGESPYRDVLASIFISLGKHLNPSDNLATEFQALLVQALNNPIDRIFRMAIYAAIGQLGGTPGIGVDKPKLEELLKLVANKLGNSADPEECRVAFKVYRTLLNKSTAPLSQELNDTIIPQITRILNGTDAKLQPLAAEVMLKLLTHDYALASTCNVPFSALTNNGRSVFLLCLLAICGHTGQNGLIVSEIQSDNKSNVKENFVDAMYCMIQGFISMNTDWVNSCNKFDLATKKCNFMLSAHFTSNDEHSDRKKISAMNWSIEVLREHARNNAKLSGAHQIGAPKFPDCLNTLSHMREQWASSLHSEDLHLLSKYEELAKCCTTSAPERPVGLLGLGFIWE